jgi:hypothetical protein
MRGDRIYADCQEQIEEHFLIGVGDEEGLIFSKPVPVDWEVGGTLQLVTKGLKASQTGD